MPEISADSRSLLWAILLASALTLILKTFPVVALKGSDFPKVLKRWLDFVPVAVMAALVGPDIFIYEGKPDFSTSNLFMLVSLPVFLVAWKTSNYFVTIAVGLALVIAARYFGLA